LVIAPTARQPIVRAELFPGSLSPLRGLFRRKKLSSTRR